MSAADPLSPLPLFSPSRGGTRATAAMLALAAAVSWIAAGYDLGEVRTALSVQGGDSLAPAELLGHQRAGRILLTVQLATAVGVALAFVPWLHQMRANVRAFGARRLRWGREWTYLGVLLPVLNLYRPCQVVSEVWRASDPASIDPIGWRERPTSPLVYAWWGLLLAWLAAELGSGLLLQLASGLSRIQLAHGLALAGDVCAALSASAGCLWVVRLGRAQQAKWAATARVRSAPGA